MCAVTANPRSSAGGKGCGEGLTGGVRRAPLPGGAARLCSRRDPLSLGFPARPARMSSALPCQGCSDHGVNTCAARNRGSLRRSLFRSRPARPPAIPQSRAANKEATLEPREKPELLTERLLQQRAGPLPDPTLLCPPRGLGGGNSPTECPREALEAQRGEGPGAMEGPGPLVPVPAGSGSRSLSMAPRPLEPCLAGAGEAHAPRSGPSPGPVEPEGCTSLPSSRESGQDQMPEGPLGAGRAGQTGVKGSPSSSLPCLVLPG